jgi:hypothetical protein
MTDENRNLAYPTFTSIQRAGLPIILAAARVLRLV